jgi:hypothetical protein
MSAFDDYLECLGCPQADQARLLWKVLKELQVADPTGAGPNEDGDVYTFVWDKGRHHLEIEIDRSMDVPQESWYWFYRDRGTETCSDGTGGEAEVAEEVKRHPWLKE